RQPRRRALGERLVLRDDQRALPLRDALLKQPRLRLAVTVELATVPTGVACRGGADCEAGAVPAGVPPQVNAALTVSSARLTARHDSTLAPDDRPDDVHVVLVRQH